MIKRLLLILSGLVVGAAGLLTGLLEVLAVVDPVGTKLSDDADPLGDPSISVLQHLFFVVMTLALLILSAWLLHRSDKDIRNR